MDLKTMICAILGDCGYADIEPMFGDMDEDLFYDAVQMVKVNGGELSANGIWYEAIYNAICQVFGDEYVDYFEIYPNCMASSVGVYDGMAKKIKGFKAKAAEFEELTGYSVY